MLRVNEIFKSILGESTYAGSICGIIRLSGCNLRCRYCDTQYAYDEFFPSTIEKICIQIDQYKTSVILLTGGEPLLQEESYELMKRLLKKEYTVLLETNGSQSIERVPLGVIKILDLKCPGSRESHQMYWGNLNKLLPSDEIKFVISNQADLEWATNIIHEYQLGKTAKVLFSSVYGSIDASILADWILQKNLPVRLHLQIHKLIWGEGVRGK